MRLILFDVLPKVFTHISLIPASFNNFFVSLLATSPTPLGAGINSTFTDPEWPLVLKAIECSSPHPHSQSPQPLLIFMTLNLAFLNDFSIALLDSTLDPLPTPIRPLPSPMTNSADVLNLLPEL